MFLISALNLSAFVYPFFIFVAIVSLLFLFWRACRHELMNSYEAFDLLVVGALGAIISSRIFDFIFKTDASSWSIDKLLFFNRYGSFDFWGALFGLFVALFLFLRNKKTKLWFMLDLFAAPLVLAQAIIAIGAYLSSGDRVWIYFFVGYFLIFFFLKRLATKKRHNGFFACFYLTATTLLSVGILGFAYFVNPSFDVRYELLAPIVFFVCGIVSWYFVSKRKIRSDLKKVSVWFLLSLFRTKRMLLSQEEAGKFSKSILFSPLYILKLLYTICLGVLKEIRLGLFDFFYVLGFRRHYKSGVKSWSRILK